MIEEEILKSKKELREYIYNKKWLEERWNDIEERRSLLEKITTTLSDLPKGSPPVNDRIAEQLASILDMTDKYEEYLKDLNEKQIKIENRISKLDPSYRNILYFRYIRGLNWYDVADKVNYDYTYTKTLHKEALIKYSKT